MELKNPPGYIRLAPFNRDRHRGMAAPSSGLAAFTAGLNAVSLLAAEFIPASRHYPIVFVRDGDTGKPVPVAVTGMQESNRFVDADGEWRGDCYIPAYVRRYPFVSVPVKRNGAAEPEILVCVDEAALEPSEEPYFDADGAPTERWQPYERLLKALDTGRGQTEALCARIDALELLEPFEAHSNPKEGPPARLRGMLRVAEGKLNALDADTLKDLMQQGQLSRIYAHLMSLDNFRSLA